MDNIYHTSMARKSTTKYIYTNLPIAGDAELIAFIESAKGNGAASKTRNALRALWMVYKQNAQASQTLQNQKE